MRTIILMLTVMLCKTIDYNAYIQYKPDKWLFLVIFSIALIGDLLQFMRRLDN
jgi:hypothetical protein